MGLEHLPEGLDPARIIDRMALPRSRGAELQALTDIEKAIVNKADWRATRNVQRRDFGGTLAGVVAGVRVKGRRAKP
jgi:hypothetical protein